MGTSFGDAVSSRCWARWWGLFKEYTCKKIRLFSFFPPNPCGEDRSVKEPREEKEKGIYLRSTLDRVFPAKGFFTRSCVHVNRSCLFPLWLFCIKLQFATSGLWLSFKIRGSWMAGCNIPWNWPPDTCISWSVPIQSLSCIFECIDRVVLAFFTPIWDCVFRFDFALPRVSEIYFCSKSSSLHKHRRSFRFIALSGAKIWQW